jgi:hypothetical protein
MYVKKGDHGDTSVPAIIPATHSVTKQCDLEGIKCPSCLLAKQTKRATGAHQMCNNPQREMAIRRETMRPGQEISGNQCICQTPGQLAHTFGKENAALHCHGGTIFVDHYSGFIFIGNQVSLRAGKTAATKCALPPRHT